MICNVINTVLGSWSAAQGGSLKAKCRVVYASRTHSQLAQVIQEFRNSPYKHVSSVILASREQLCINEQLASASDKNQMCRAKIKTRSCEYYNNIEKVSKMHVQHYRYLEFNIVYSKLIGP